MADHQGITVGFLAELGRVVYSFRGDGQTSRAAAGRSISNQPMNGRPLFCSDYPAPPGAMNHDFAFLRKVSHSSECLRNVVARPPPPLYSPVWATGDLEMGHYEQERLCGT